ncbi:hypothetical protein D9M71_587270 [compost metagenome]
MGRQGARTQSALMPATMDLRMQSLLGTRTDVQRTDAFGAVQFMRGKRHQVHRPLREIDRHFARALCGVDMEQSPAFTHDLTDGRNIVERPQFVVDQHQRHQESVLAHGFADRLRGDQPIGIRHQVRHGDTGILQLPGGIENGLVFDLAGEDMATASAAALGNALERKVVGFGGA